MTPDIQCIKVETDYIQITTRTQRINTIAGDTFNQADGSLCDNVHVA